MLGINSIIGAGIFLTPGEVIGLAGPFAPMAYVLAGIFAGVVAIVFATAARYVRTNGASYAYTTAAFGRRIGIYVGVTHAITASIAWGVLASFFVSTLLRVAFPDKAWADAEQLFSVKTLTFLGFIGVLLAINLFGNRAIKWANGTSTVGKAFALSAFIVGGLWIITTQHVNNYATAWSAYSATPYSLLGVAEIGKGTFSSMALATIVALYAFTGFESIANAAEEMDAPDRNLPRAIPIAIFSVGAIYLLTLTVAMLLGSNKIAASDDTVKLAAAIGNATFRTIIVVGALISMFGINVAASFGAPRLWTALADSGVLPTRLSRKNQYDVPMVSDLNAVVADVGSFAAEHREAIGTASDKLASITTALVDSLDDIKQTLHISPTVLQNFNNIFEPANGALTGALAGNNMANPIAFLCGAIQAASRLGGEQAAKLCVQYLAPIVKNRQYNYPPLGANLFVGAQARPNEVTYSEDWLRPDYVAPVADTPPDPAAAVTVDPATGLRGMMMPPGGGS